MGIAPGSTFFAGALIQLASRTGQAEIVDSTYRCADLLDLFAMISFSKRVSWSTRLA